MPSSTYAPILHTSVPVSLSPSTPSKTLHIPTTTSLTTALFSGSRKRPHDEISGLDEEEYSSKYLATESSIFFRPAKKFPRCLLWRILEGRKVVEVRSVDLLKEKDSDDEGGLVFRIELPAPVMKGGVVLAELKGANGIEVFILTDTKELVTVTLRRDLLARRALPRGFEASSVVAKYSPSGLGFRHAFKMIAVTSTELMVSLNDGGLLRLERSAGETGTMWRETLYGEGSWGGTLKGLVKLQRRQTVQCGEVELETSSVVGIAKSPAGGVVWTVGLDHMLKAWSTKTGRVVLQMDMLNEKHERDAQRSSKYVMAAEQGTTIRVVQTPSVGEGDAVSRREEGGRYYIAVHSPREHQFKLYEITPTFSAIDGESVRCSDLHPQAKLIPPIDELMNTNIWHLEDFHVAPGVELENSQIWLSARSGAQCQTFMLTIDALDDRENYVQSQFRTGWTAVSLGAVTVDHLRKSADFPGQTSNSSDAVATPTERWISFVFYPERFSTVSIETALTVYRKRRKLSGAPSKSLGTASVSLQERLVTAVTNKILLQRSSNDGPDYDKYHAEVHAQWVALYSILENFHIRRLELLSLAYDHQTGLAWDVAADFASPVRSNDRLELLCQNARLLDATLQDDIAPDVVQEVFPEPNGEETALMVLLDAASKLRQALPHDTNDVFRRLARQDAIIFGEDVDHGRLQALCDSSDVGREVSTEDYNALEADLAPLEGIAGLSGQLILSAIDLLDDLVKAKGQSRDVEVCEFGTKLSMAIAQQSHQQTEKLILDLLMLITFFAGDLEEGDLSDDFINAEESIFRALMVKLRHVSLRLWTVGHSYTERSGADGGPSLTATIYEHFFMSEWDAQSVQGASDDMATSLTSWNKRWINGLNLYRKWSANTLHIFSMLLQSKLFDLATDFARFLDDSPWSRHLQGRLNLVLADYEAAALLFDHAAEGLSAENRDIIAQLDSASLLSPDEHRFFGDGQARYYQGIATLFSDLKAYSHTGEFASKALRHVHGAGSLEKRLLDIDFRNTQSDSPFQARIDNGVEEVRLMKLKVFRDEIADQMFDALVKTGRFVEAYEALRKTSTEKEAENLQQLVAACVKHDAVPTLLELRFTDEHADMIDAALADLAHKNPASVFKPFHQILYTFRSSRSNFRGAAEVLHEHLGRLRHSADARYQDPEDETVLQVYLLLINTLACCGKGEEWFLADPVEGLSKAGDVRKLVTLEDVRRGYAKELDLRSDLVMGRFAVGDEMDVLVSMALLIGFRLQRIWREIITPSKNDVNKAVVHTATSYEEYQAAALQADHDDAKTWWRDMADCYLYGWEVIQDRLRILLETMESGDVHRLMQILHTGMDRKKADILRPKLYTKALSGTKTLIEQYITAMCTGVRTVTEWPTPRDGSSKLRSQQKLDFLYYSYLAYGRTCLVLQGGSIFGLCHLGVVKEMLKQGLLPTIISGSATGALMAAVVGVHTDDELRDILKGEKFDLHHFDLSAKRMAKKDKAITGHAPPWWQRYAELTYRRLRRWLESGFILDPKVLGATVKSNLGDITFKEAFDHTGRVLNITIAPAGPGSITALNYLTTPDALIWSAALLSNFTPATADHAKPLMMKTHDNVIREYWPRSPTVQPPQKVIHPLTSPLSTLCNHFSVNHFIISRARPSFSLSKIPSPINLEDWPLLEGLTRVFRSEVKHRFRMFASLLPGRLSNNRFVHPGILPGEHLTIHPEVSWLDGWRLLKNPTAEDIDHWICSGEKSVWPRVKELRPRLAIELEIGEGYRKVKKRKEIADKKARVETNGGGETESMAVAKRKGRTRSEGLAG
ncbi:hypothetical protein B0A48_08036 [Cryoendolithus antarcticus]|uniref:PNPLA domain-containing protein n=1 Tax=Cryoendolithus antarcticus TaxID=1507870 RepID=A0A1V8T0T8_9PEZI|nr:hypothetical protein B0A48_08036 [Cryoendolithus antarcticus]